LGSAPRRVVLHVGTPKSGTTFLQRAMWHHHATLKEQGYRCVGDRPKDAFLAAIDVRGSHDFWGYPEARISGRWAAVCRQAREHAGTSIISHEVLGAASEEQVERAMAELEGLDVHLVLTARDLARQVTSEWQERIKNGSSRSFAKFERRLRRQMRNGDFTAGFWRNQDPVGVLDRWARNLPASHIHVVVAPQSAADPTLLWHRFADAVGFDATGIDPRVSGEAANTTLGVAQIAVLRQVNAALARRIRQPEYGRLVKSQFAERLLAAQSSPRPQCPPGLAARLRRLAEERNETIRQRGYLVHGDLAELLPVEPSGEYHAPDDVDRRQERLAYGDALAELLVHRSEQERRSSLPVLQDATPTGARLRRLGHRLESWRRSRRRR
jgi:hypothetical protein